MIYKIDLDKIKAEYDIVFYTNRDIIRKALTEIIGQISFNNSGLIVDINILDILYVSDSFSSPEIKTINKNLTLRGTFNGRDVYVDNSGFLKVNEYCFKENPQYLQHINKLKLNKKLNKISKI